MGQVHDWYSLRWQIKILFKTWKSFFHIHHCKKIKRERLECHLYGQLIAILLCSSTMFQMRQLLLMKKKRELSEYKAIYMIKDYFFLFIKPYRKTSKNYQRFSFACSTSYSKMGENLIGMRRKQSLIY